MIYILDVESAGLQVPENGGGVCDLAIMEIDIDCEILAQVESLIDPEMPISASASGIHHITDSDVVDAPTLAEFMDLYSNPLMDAVVVIGHNVAFDIRFLKAHLPKSFEVLDTLKLARLTWPELENHKLQTIRYHFGLDAGEAHRAMGDVMTTHSLIKLLCEVHNTDLAGLRDLSKKPLSLNTKMPFGKHKDMALGDLPMNYVRWLLNSTDIDPDLRQALEQRL